MFNLKNLFKKKDKPTCGVWKFKGIIYEDIHECLCSYECSVCGNECVRNIGNTPCKCSSCKSIMNGKIL